MIHDPSSPVSNSAAVVVPVKLTASTVLLERVDEEVVSFKENSSNNSMTTKDSEASNNSALPNGRSMDDEVAVQSPASGATTTLLVEPHAAIKVIKGEIHNVLTVLRAQRFFENTSEESTTEVQPFSVVQQLQELHQSLPLQEETTIPSCLSYLPPFCAAVQGREISAAVTGAALSALRKFLLYGFLLPDTCGDEASHGMTLIAQALLNCTFEESTESTVNTHEASASSASSPISPNKTPQQQRRSSSSQQRQTNHQAHDEQVVLKLLDTSALVVRCSLQTVNLLDSKLVVGLLDTCLHVSHRAERASPLLKSAAVDALSQIVLQVFAGRGEPVMKARQEILVQLASLLNPAEHSEQVTASSLTAVNIALETCREPLTEEEIGILQNDMCKYLLQWSTTHDLMILSLTLRVIFNLFQSIRNHLKVPLEVFLTSVHLRILETDQAGREEREVILESLLEFCQEPALMQDLYLNYDCDVACTNLYESVVATLGKVAQPAGWNKNQTSMNSTSTSGGTTTTMNTATTATETKKTTTTAASGGTLSVGSTHTSSAQTSNATVSSPTTTAASSSSSPSQLNRLATEGILAILDSIARRCQQPESAPTSGQSVSLHSFLSDDGTAPKLDDNVSTTIEFKSQVSDLELHERRQKKTSLSKIARSFNANPMSKEWIELAVEQELLSNSENAKGVAELLYTAPGLDKVKLGIYLSKGPDADYPFEAVVREHFVAQYDFKEMTFPVALRKFLSKFRLPGEAQCIDRLMEAFSKELYEQQGESSFFKNSDAVYVLSFSTIMLNTDLHNPTIKDEKRMTAEQFVRNNRGINGGEDLPKDFLIDLYEQIKDHQIQVKRELGEFMKEHRHEDFRTAWEGILSKSREVATPFFTPAGTARQSLPKAGVHDKEMFVILSKWALACLPGIFMRSWDDGLVVRAMRAMQQLAEIAAYFELDSTINDILQALLPQGREYIAGCITSDYAGEFDSGGSVVGASTRTVASGESTDEEDTVVLESDQEIPYTMLCSHDGESEVDITGSAAHRGLLALDCALVLVRKHTKRITSAWPKYIECLCALRDAKALPQALSDLDDFADSNGNVLPLSSFAKTSQKRLEDRYRSQSDPDANNKKSWFRAFFDKKNRRKGAREDDSVNGDDESVVRKKGETSAYAKMLLAIAEAADVENVVQIGSTMIPAADHMIQALLEAIDEYPFDGDPIVEQHAIFSLELAARALLSNRERATELFILFLVKFEKVLGRVTDKNVPAPFAIERVVVTILRSSIHLYDLSELRPTLRASLHLITMSLHRSFIRHIADRIACGLAIILRNSYYYFETPNEWAFMGDTLDMLANFGPARVFVFDGIASTVEYALPQPDAAKGDDEDDYADRPPLSKEACNSLSRILIRFVLGFYQHSDLSLTIPAMLCLEKIYRHKVEVLLQAQAEENGKEGSDLDLETAVPDKEAWQNVAVAVYSVCRSSDADVSRHGMECYQRLILRTATDQIPDEKWIAISYLMVNKQPPTAADLSRGNAFSLLGQLLIKILPDMSHKDEMREDLVDLIGQTASLAQENLRHGRRGSISPLFEKTLATVTYLSNTMMMDDWKGEPDFSSWASETLLAELEKVGAAGASLKNQAAIRPAAKNDSSHSADDDEVPTEEDDVQEEDESES